MLRLDVAALSIGVAGGRVDDFRFQPCLLHQLLTFDAVLLRILFKVQIVQQPDDSPEVLLLAVAKLSGKTAHHLFHRPAVAQVEGILIVLLEQLISLWLCPFCLHIPPSFPVIAYSVFLL